MIDLISFNRALKSTWAKTYLNPENYGKWMAAQSLSEETLIDTTYLNLLTQRISYIFRQR